jgi:hypothetical protein
MGQGGEILRRQGGVGQTVAVDAAAAAAAALAVSRNSESRALVASSVCPATGMSQYSARGRHSSRYRLPFRVDHQRIVTDERLSPPVLILGLEVELDNQLREQQAFREMWVALEIGAMGFAPDHDLIGKHGALRCDERGRAVLLLEGDRQAAGPQQPKHVAGGGVGEQSLVGNDVMLGAVAGGDVVLGDDSHQIGAAGGLINKSLLVLPTVTRAPSEWLVVGRSAVLVSTAGSCLCFKSIANDDTTSLLPRINRGQ